MAVLHIDAADAAGLAALDRLTGPRRNSAREQGGHRGEQGTSNAGDCATDPALLRSIAVVVADVAGLVRQRVTGGAADLLALAAHEAGVALIVIGDVVAGRPVGDADLQRLAAAGGRLADMWGACNGGIC